MGIELRDYQRECVDAVVSAGDGRHLVVMATGLGKTVTFASIPRRGRVLILSHRDELVRQPGRYYDCAFGIEKAGEESHGEEVVSATVQTLASERRLARFAPGEFDMVITDEAHHAVAPTYRRVIEHLAPRVHLGFTATPNRADGRGLSAAFDDIVFERDLRWGIEQGYLSDIDCRRVVVGWSTDGVKRRAGDFAAGELDCRVNNAKSNAQVAEAYARLAVGQTLVFATSVAHARALSALIPGSVAVDGKTPADERRAILAAFAAREIPCLVNCGVFTEGTDLPLIETVLLARPTTNQALYAQMVGRGLRLAPGKGALRLIDCVGATVDNRLCTAPSLFGIDESELTEESRGAVDGPITGLRRRIEDADDTPYGWVIREQRVDLVAAEGLVAWIRSPGGVRIVKGEGFEVSLAGPDLMGRYSLSAAVGGERTEGDFATFSEADREAYGLLASSPEGEGARALWDAGAVRRWGRRPASEKQVSYLMGLLPPDQLRRLGSMPLTKREAMVAIGAALDARRGREARVNGRCPLCGEALRRSRSGKTLQCASNRYGSRGGELVLESGCGFSAPVDRAAASALAGLPPTSRAERVSLSVRDAAGFAIGLSEGDEVAVVAQAFAAARGPWKVLDARARVAAPPRAGGRAGTARVELDVDYRGSGEVERAAARGREMAVMPA